MLKRFFMIAVLVLLPGKAYSQNEAGKPIGNGYIFIAPGVEACCGHSDTVMQLGGGGEATMYRGLGVNLDAGYLFPTDRPGAGAFTVSTGPTYLFNRFQKTVPFITGGVSVAFRSQFGGAYHFGGGAIHWFHRRWGLRFEVRDHIAAGNASNHLVVFRAGLALR